MTMEGKPHIRPTLRVLTAEEMINGLDIAAWAPLARQAEDILTRRASDIADAALDDFARQNRELAEVRLADGLPAYIKLDGIDGIVRQMPDGTRDVIEITDGILTIVKRLSPAGWPAE